MPIIFDFIKSIVLDISQTLSLACKSDVFPLLAVLILENIWVYVCSSDYSNVIVNIKAFVN